MGRKKSTKNTCWCFTINNYEKKDLWKLDTLTGYITSAGKDTDDERNVTLRYLVYGYETAPDTGTPHLQGFAQFWDEISFETVKKHLGKRAHVEAMLKRSSAKACSEYCKKGGYYEEFGKAPRQGRRTDLDNIRRDLMTGKKSLRTVALSTRNYQQLKFAETYNKYTTSMTSLLTRKNPLVFWIYGKTGSGKTLTAVECIKRLFRDSLDDNLWISSNSLRWWQGYWGQKAVIVDELRGDATTYSNFLRITDRYPYQVEFKGGSAWLNAEIIIVTAPYKPEDTWFNLEDQTQLLRRIDTTFKYKEFSEEKIEENLKIMIEKYNKRFLDVQEYTTAKK